MDLVESNDFLFLCFFSFEKKMWREVISYTNIYRIFEILKFLHFVMPFKMPDKIIKFTNIYISLLF